MTVGLCFGVEAQASAQRDAVPPAASPSSVWDASAVLAGRANPLGLSVQVEVAHSRSLFASNNVLLEQNFVRPFATATVSPSRAMGGVGLVLQPLSVLGIKSSFQALHTFGTFGTLHSFPGSTFPWDDDDLATRERDPAGVKARNEGEASGKRGGHVFQVATYVQLKVGRILARSEGGVTRTWHRLPAGASVVYDPGEDILLRNGGYSTFVNADALAVRFPLDAMRSGLSLRTFDARTQGAPRAERLRNARLGPTLLWTLAPGQTLAVFAHWYVLHPYRAQGARAALPSFALAFERSVEFLRHTSALPRIPAGAPTGAPSDAPATP